MLSWSRFAALAPLVLVIGGCGGGPDPKAFDNRVFYQYDDTSAGANLAAFEQRYPPLDLQERAPSPEYVGVSLIGSSVHLSRPKNWILQSANNQAEHRYIRYVSPNQYIFAIYERTDGPDDLWRDIMKRFEDDAKNDGAEILGSHVPIATWNAQGRAYVVKRRVKAAKGPYIGLSREFLARSDHRVVLVQIVHQGDNLGALSDELLRVIQTLEIL